MANIIQKSPVKPARSTVIDEYDSSTTYIGKAKLGALTADAVWQIRKIVVNGTVTTIKWADSNERYDNVWDDRTALTYT